MSENLNSENAVLTGAKQTMASWSKVIESYEAVPDIYKGFFNSRLVNTQQFPYTLLTPALVKPKGKTTEKLIYDSMDAIHVLERTGDHVVATSYPYQTVCTVEVGSILLSSWLTISGMTDTDEASVSTIYYNTSSARHFATFMAKLRPLPNGADEAQFKVEKNKFDYLSSLNFKLMNYGRSGLVCGEAVRQILLQPAIKEPIWTMLGNLFQYTLSAAHLVVLTDRELILIQDMKPGRKIKEPHYGGIWQYIPLRSIRSVTWRESENGRLTLSVAVAPDQTIEKLFAVSSKPELEQLCAHFRK